MTSEAKNSALQKEHNTLLTKLQTARSPYTDKTVPKGFLNFSKTEWSPNHRRYLFFHASIIWLFSLVLHSNSLIPIKFLTGSSKGILYNAEFYSVNSVRHEKEKSMTTALQKPAFLQHFLLAVTTAETQAKSTQCSQNKGFRTLHTEWARIHSHKVMHAPAIAKVIDFVHRCLS